MGWLRAAAAIAARPGLWPVAMVQLFRLAPSGWWRRPPFLPLPDPAYLRFRLETAYGDPACVPDAHDLVSYLTWCRRWGRSMR